MARRQRFAPLSSQPKGSLFCSRWWIEMATRVMLLIVVFGVPAVSTEKYHTTDGQQQRAYYEAIVNITYDDKSTSSGKKSESKQMGSYGPDSLVDSATGILFHVKTIENNSTDGCKEYSVSTPKVQWIALVKRGSCAFTQKIKMAQRYNASAVVIYNNEDKFAIMEHTVKDVVSILIPKKEGERLAHMVDSGREITMKISVGKQELTQSHLGNSLSRTSVLFVSISFIVLMLISLAWLVFYYIQRFRYAHAKERLARRLASAAKKAIGKIPQKSVKSGDRELDSEFDQCAVCIEGYKAHDVIRTLPCKHVFHKSCVDPWLLDQRSCPMCKLDILRAYGMQVGGSQDSVHPDGESGAVSVHVDEAEQTSTADEQGDEGEVKVLLIPHSNLYIHQESGACGESSHTQMYSSPEPGSSSMLGEVESVRSLNDLECTELHSLMGHMDSGQGDSDVQNSSSLQMGLEGGQHGEEFA